MQHSRLLLYLLLRISRNDEYLYGKIVPEEKQRVPIFLNRVSPVFKYTYVRKDNFPFENQV